MLPEAPTRAPSTLASVATRRPKVAHDRNLHLPSFKGTANPKGYFALFETLAAGLTDDKETWKRYRAAKLEGPAKAWLMGQGDAWTTWNYEQLKQKLLTHF